MRGSRGGAAAADFEDQAVIVNGNSRWCNYYVEGVRWVLRHLKLDGIYLDGIRFPRATSQRLRHVFDAEAAARRAAGASGASDAGARGAAAVDASAPLLDLHAGPNLRSFIEHMPYLDSIWVGENILWEKTGPDYWLVAISGLPFGLHADMLGPAAGAANAMRGMVFGMLVRAGWGGSKSAQNARLWALWDAFGLEHAQMQGWWEPRPTAATGSAAVVATAYVRRGLRALIAVGSWQKSPWRGAIALNWTELGLDPASCRIKLLGGEGRPPQLLRAADLRAISVPPGNGLLLRIDAPGSDDGGGGGGGGGDVGDLQGSSTRRRRGRGKGRGRGRGRGKRRGEA